MLTLQQTTELLKDASKLNKHQLKLIRRLHFANMVKHNRVASTNCNNELFANKPIGDIRHNKAIGKKYEKIRTGINKAATTEVPAMAIDPNTGEYVPFNPLQKNIMRKAMLNGKTRKQAILEARYAKRY